MEFIGMGNIENGRLIIYIAKDASKCRYYENLLLKKNLQLQYNMKIINE
jgi:hypothetical protein